MPAWCRARKTIDATILATLVGVDGAIEWHLWRFVVSDDLAAAVSKNLGENFDFAPLLFLLPAVIEGLARKLHVVGGHIAGKATAFYDGWKQDQ